MHNPTQWHYFIYFWLYCNIVRLEVFWFHDLMHCVAERVHLNAMLCHRLLETSHFIGCI